MVCQLNMNQVGRTGGIDVKAEDIIDIIDGYKGGGYGVSTQHELGGYTLVRTGLIAFQVDGDIIDGCKRSVSRCIQLLTGLVGKTMNKQS